MRVRAPVSVLQQQPYRFRNKLQFLTTRNEFKATKTSIHTYTHVRTTRTTHSTHTRTHTHTHTRELVRRRVRPTHMLYQVL